MPQIHITRVSCLTNFHWSPVLKLTATLSSIMIIFITLLCPQLLLDDGNVVLIIQKHLNNTVAQHVQFGLSSFIIIYMYRHI